MWSSAESRGSACCRRLTCDYRLNPSLVLSMEAQLPKLYVSSGNITNRDHQSFSPRHHPKVRAIVYLPRLRALWEKKYQQHCNALYCTPMANTRSPTITTRDPSLRRNLYEETVVTLNWKFLQSRQNVRKTNGMDSEREKQETVQINRAVNECFRQ